MGKRIKKSRVVNRSILMVLLVSLFAVGVMFVADDAKAEENKRFKIFLSLSYSGNVWQSSAANIVKALAKTPPYDEMVELTEVISGSNVEKQISDYQSMIANGADGIISFPVSPTGLNRVIREGSKKGVLFFMYDSTVTEPSAYNVSYITAGHGENTAQYLVNLMGGKGTVMINRGVPGNSVDMRHYNGSMAIFKRYPGIKVVNEYYGYWDDAKSQQATSQALAAYPDVDGICSQLGEYGVLRACLASGSKKIPFIVGEDTNGIRLAFADPEMQKRGLKGVSAGSPPATAGYAFKLMMELLTENRKDLVHNIEYPLPWVEWDKVKLCKGDVFEDGCNCFPADKVAPTMTDEVLHPVLLPEISLKSAQTGEPMPGARIQPLPKDVTEARSEPGINCNPKSGKCVDPVYEPYMVTPIPVPK
ncbi:MAG: ABC transporter substrate-binding protein [Deltaproteobacteria bacterium]|nr:ABC transporter substrate-binding protein [Deltaproteobacteria bacterium]